ncbi:MAG TPA: SMP-30/gluconolactonase/LRE family protein [Acetobacteraceae bacterium]|nr:SMP-30/gluconolactonase/LRE family protein [Acetobacteraceae bacterium]
MADIANTSHFYELVSRNARVERLGTGFTFTEGPVWNHSGKFLLFSDMPADVRRRWDAVGGVREMQRPSNKGNGMTYEVDGSLLICEHVTSSVVRLRPDGSRQTVASHYQGKELNSPNDIVVAKDNSLYFSDPTYGRMPVFGLERKQDLSFQGVYRVQPSGEGIQLLANDFEQPNGLCFSPDESLLYINDSPRAHIRVYKVAKDGTIGGGSVFFDHIGSGAIEEGIPDGMKCDEAGNIYVSGPGGIWVISPEAKLLGRIDVPENVGNLNWGGDAWKTLFICASTSLYKIDLGVSGNRLPYMV